MYIIFNDKTIRKRKISVGKILLILQFLINLIWLFNRIIHQLIDNMEMELICDELEIGLNIRV